MILRRCKLCNDLKGHTFTYRNAKGHKIYTDHLGQVWAGAVCSPCKWKRDAASAKARQAKRSPKPITLRKETPSTTEDPAVLRGPKEDFYVKYVGKRICKECHRHMSDSRWWTCERCLPVLPSDDGQTVGHYSDRRGWVSL
jgi:hypothetical protein